MSVKAQGVTTKIGIIKKPPTPGSKTQKRKEGRKKHVNPK